MYLAGAQMQPASVLELIRRLRDAWYETTAEKVERALLVRSVQVRLLRTDREAILRVTGDRRPEYAELRRRCFTSTSATAAGPPDRSGLSLRRCRQRARARAAPLRAV
jgi:hypothetical protein